MSEERIVVYRGDSIIFLARDEENRSVLIKEPAGDNPSPKEIEALDNEYDITRQFNIAGIRKALKSELIANKPVLTLEYVEGKTLKEFIKEPSVRFEDKLVLALELSDIMEEVHKRYIVHNDLNSSNILVANNGSKLVLIDFGNAFRCAGSERFPRVATFHKEELPFISPEQAGRLNRPPDFRSDLYSIGVVLYEMFTGRLPFQSEDPQELIHKQIAELPVSPTVVSRVVPEAVSDIILKLLEKDPEDRYQSTIVLQNDLVECVYQFKKNGVIKSFPIARHNYSGELRFPGSLYGREKETHALMETLQRARNGNAEVMIVTGYPGSGKTSLVRELQKPLQNSTGLFIEGKYDPYPRNVPYTAFSRAFRGFVSWVLREPEDKFENWRASLSETLGDFGKIITDVIPDLQLIIGPQKEVPQLEGRQAENRFDYFFEKFINVITAEIRPLVLFLDDVQWIDTASLDLLKSLIGSFERKGLYVVCAYRVNEVDSSHPLLLALSQIENEGARITRIALGNITAACVKEFVRDTLSPCFHAEDLGALIYEKTQGNPFFIRRLMTTLHEGGYIKFNPNAQRWGWDLESIKEIPITENVVDLLLAKIASLPPATQEVMKIASCVGQRFDGSMLSAICDWSEAEIARALEDGERSILINRDDDSYRFAHDRIQQAVHSLVDASKKQKIHLRVGRQLLARYSKDSVPESLFQIVDHLNSGVSLVTEPNERKEIARLNLFAAEKARESTAYDDTLLYVEKGIQLLACDCWETDYDLALRLYQEAIEAEYLNANHERVETRAAALLSNVRTLLEKVKIYEVLIQSQYAENRMENSIHTGIQVLEMLGVTLSNSPPKDVDIEGLYHLPQMVDPEKLAVVRILRFLWASSVSSKQEVLLKVIYTLVDQCIKHGNSTYSSFAYASYGSVLCWHLESMEKGFKYGDLAMRVLEKFGGGITQYRVMEIVYSFIEPWRVHIRVVVDKLRKLAVASQVYGEVEVSATARQSLCVILFFIGEPLETVCDEQICYIEIIMKKKYDFHLKLASMWVQLALNLNGRTKDPSRLYGQYFDEEKMIRYESEHGFFLFYFYFAKTVLGYWLEDYEGAFKNLNKAANYTEHLVGFPIISYYVFYHSLIHLRMYHRVKKSGQKEFLKRVQLNQLKMKEWASHAPMNYQHKHDLVEAEIQRALGHFDRAMQYYEKAIKGARGNQYLHEEALGYELAGECCLARGLEDMAHHYLQNALYLFKKWGAKVKVKKIEERYPDLVKVAQTWSDAEQSPELSYLDSSRLDLSSIIKASHTISSERNLENLLNKIMNILMENAGADRGAVLLKQDGVWFVQAEGDFKVKQYAVLLNAPYNGKADDNSKIPVPNSILNACIHSKETIVLNDVVQDRRFSDDVYFEKRHVKSALCIPLMYKGEFYGILYLENSLSRNVFSDSMINTLQLLSTQFSISLENALLYNSLNELLEFEKLLSEITAAFVNLPTGEVDRQISHWLEKLVEFLRVDRAAIYEYKKGESVFSVSNYYAAPGIPKPPVFVKGHSRFVEMLLGGQVILFEKIEDIPEEVEEGRNYFRNEGIKSYVALPVSIGGSFLGVIEFVSFNIERSWKTEIVKRLRILEEIFANALDRKKNEDRLQSRTLELMETAVKLKKLSAYLEEVREQERAHIAREIHDELGSALTILKMDTSWVGRHLIHEPKILKEKLHEIAELIDSTVKTVQRISTELRPAILDNLGLFDAIQWYTKDFQRRERVSCRVTCDGGEVENKKAAIVLFRILQEALTNVSRHAHASEVKVHMEMNTDYAALTITDNGKGISQSEIQSKNSLGLIGMRERVSFLNGNLEISGIKNKGTTVKVTLPLRGDGID